MPCRQALANRAMHEGIHGKEPTMTQEIQNKANIVNSAELKELLGPPPVLSSENAKAYDEIAARLMECFGPRDFMEQLLIKQLVDDTWDSMRYARHKSLGIERKARQLREFQAKRAKALAQMRRSGSAPYPATELGRMYELEDTVENTVNDVDAILDRPTAELDHARALEKSIVYHLQLDQLLNTAVARRDDALEQLERYRRGSGKRLRKTSEEIIDAEYNVVAQSKDLAPPLVPSSEGSP
jgi:uncharacterized protein YicC (UPF0701 family)